MEIGIVVFYDASAGSGIIRMADSGQEVIVHATGLRDAVRSGDRVVFDVRETARGLIADNVRLA